ncbi:MAG: hypothetical protein ACRC2T_03530, partial [Thermoguttaceae bacterium]
MKTKIPCLFLACTITLICVFFGPVLWGGKQFAFRDGSHFYFPLFKYIQEEWNAGRIPLWMPYENLGQPLIGNPASSIFYPGKLVFFLSAIFPISFTFTYHLYAVLHVFLAACTMYRLARYFSVSKEAATLAGITYAFGGVVLYQHLNIIFLVGAAWLPESIRLAFRIKEESYKKATPEIRVNQILLGTVLALMLLGGDVQCAYLSGIIAFIIIGVKKIAVPFLIAFILGAIQIFPAFEFSQGSNRATNTLPHSVWEVPKVLLHEDAASKIKDGFLCRDLTERGHTRNTYLYSLTPWRLVEFVIPNAGGKQYPANTRWIYATTWDNYVWVPSLYMGVIPIIFAASVFFKKGNRFFFAILLVSLLGSLGYFGVGWFVNVFGYGVKDFGASPSGIGSPVGGVYWLMNLLLPGFTQFRYPPKLLVFTVLAASFLAAKGLDAYITKTAIKKIILFVAATLFLLTTSVATWFAFKYFSATTPPNCPMFGPCDIDVAATQLIYNSILPASLSLIAFAVISLLIFKPKNMQAKPQYFGILIVIFACVDICLANAWLVPTVPQTVYEHKSPIAEIISKHTVTQGCPPRIYRYSIWYPKRFKAESDANRLAESVQFDITSIAPEFNLLNKYAIADTQGTMMLADYTERLRQIRSSTENFEDELAQVDVDYVILPARKLLNREKAERLYVDAKWDVSLWKLKENIYIEDNNITHPADTSLWKYSEYTPNKTVIEFNFSQNEKPQELVLTEQFYPGWQAVITLEDGT